MEPPKPLARKICYRALRIDENPKDGLKAAAPDSKVTLQEHILNGSSGLKSPYISATAELAVAISFGGPFQDIVAIDWAAWQEQEKGDIVDFTLGDNRVTLLRDQDNRLLNNEIVYSERSKELLLRGQVSKKHVFPLKRTFTLQSRLSCITGEDHFPRTTRDLESTNFSLIDRYLGTNDGMFLACWKVDDRKKHNLLYKRARPNIGEKLADAAQLCSNLRQEFLALRYAYSVTALGLTLLEPLSLVGRVRPELLLL